MSTRYYGPPEGYRLDLADAGWWALVEVESGERVARVLEQHVRLLADRERLVAYRSGGVIRMKPAAAGLADTDWAVSEYGEPVTVGDLRRGVAP